MNTEVQGIVILILLIILQIKKKQELFGKKLVKGLVVLII